MTTYAQSTVKIPANIVGTGNITVTQSAGVFTISDDTDGIEAAINSAVAMGDANYTITTARVVLTGATFTAARTLTLPAASSRPAGSAITFADQALGIAYDSYVAITRAGSDTVNGTTAYNVRVTGAGVTLVTDGVSKWTATSMVHNDWALRSDRSAWVDGTQILYFPRNHDDLNFFVGEGGRNIVFQALVSGYANLGVGMRCLTNLTTGSYNVFGGLEAGEAITTGSWNTGWGEAVMVYHTTSTYCTAVGWKAGLGKSTGSSTSRSTWVGAAAGLAWLSGEDNVFVGAYAGGTGLTFGTGNRNTVLGTSAGYLISSGSGNNLFGAYAGQNITTGSQNTIFGDNAAQTLTTGTGNTIFGSYVDATSASMSNTLILGTNSRKLIWSDGASSKFLNYTNDSTAFEAVTVASGSTYIKATQATASTNPALSASGNNLLLGTGSAIATNATTGYIMLPAAAGTPTGVPVGAGAGAIAFHPDTTNNTIWMYMNSAWQNTRLRTKMISFTRDQTAATGTVAYTGVGFKPTSIFIVGGLAATGDSASVGFADSARSSASNAAFGADIQYSSNYLVATGIVGTSQVATVSSYDSDGFTLSWTKFGSPTGTVTYYAMCLC